VPHQNLIRTEKLLGTGVLTMAGLFRPRLQIKSGICVFRRIARHVALGRWFLLASAELYNPATGTFTPAGSLNTAFEFPTTTLLNSGMVLIAGGHNGGFLASAEH
jgi:hypothetical protein